MIKLPKPFTAYDKELHFAFYFLTGMLLSLLFARKNYIYHILIIWLLYCFGIFIECCQEISNTLLNKKIHGNFDIEDITYNSLGLSTACCMWAGVYLINKGKTYL